MARGKRLLKARGPYWRQRADGVPRAWGDYRHLGGRREPLCAPGETMATTDPVLAAQLYAARLAALSGGGAAVLPRAAKRQGSLSSAVAEYLAHRRAHSHVTPGWIGATERFLERAVAFYGPDRQLRTIQPDDLLAWLAHLAQPTEEGELAMTPGTVRHHMNALSGLMRRAQRTGAVPPGFNPVALLETDERPEREASTTRMLEVPEAARLLEAARTYRPGKHEPEMHLAHPLLAVFLLTGGRADEVLGLDLIDVDFARNVVRFRKNQWRRGRGGKTEGAERTVPLWPQLREILEAYLTTHHLDLRLRFDTTLLFPSPYTGGRITDIRGLCDRVARRAGLAEHVYRSRSFRVTYATARLQTLDHGAPIARKTVEVELGHKSGAMLERVYGRLGTFRCRGEVVEYQIDAVAEKADTGANLMSTVESMR